MHSRLATLLGISATCALVLGACSSQQTPNAKTLDTPSALSNQNFQKRGNDIDIQIRSDRGGANFNFQSDLNEPSQVVIEQPQPVLIEPNQEPDYYLVEPSDSRTTYGYREEEKTDVTKDPLVKVDANSRLGSVHVSAPFVKIDKDSNSRSVRIKLPGIHIDADVR